LLEHFLGPISQGGPHVETVIVQRHITLVSATIVVALALGSLLLATRHMAHSVWFDESQTSLIASQDSMSGIAEFARTVRSYPPLFFLVVHQSLRFRNDATGLRLPAAVFGALAIFAVFLLGRQLVDESTGVTAAFLFALTPGVFRYFVDGNAYSLLVLTSALSTLFLLRATSSDRLWDWLLYGLLALMGLGTHILFIFHLGAQFLAGLYLLRSRVRPATRKSYGWLVTVTTLSVLPAACFYYIYVHGGGDVRPLVFSRSMQPRMLVTLAGGYLGPLSFGSLALLALWCPLQLLGVVALFRNHTPKLWAMVILVAFPLIGITLFINSTLMYVAYRYTLGIFPLACVVAACSWKAWPRARLLARVCIGGAILTYCVAGAGFLVRADQGAFGFQDWRRASAYLSRHAAPGDKVLVSPDVCLLPLTYYYKAPGVLAADGEAVRHRAVELVQRANPRGSAVWVVLSTFANDNALVGRFTEVRPPGLEETVRQARETLSAGGYYICQSASFQRISVFAVRREPCSARIQR
jgi:4-amino-4-deoxy-L-arabinose transferase-like glycosyltransferase